ncbi:hypothetical protein MBLNU457_7785t3 [Dothideomycetes sp. NU457]
MDPSLLGPFSMDGSRQKQIQDAKDMQQVVYERANKIGSAVPPYDFIELIGKGSFGRVYKCKHRETREIVAVKIIDVDELDYKLDNAQKDEAIEDFIKEVNTLKQVKDSRAKNINNIQEAFDLHSQLWIVSDYCSGGSVHTLMKASPQPGLDEKYIIPIARELATALKHVHDASVIHRDIKCGNVLISEDGRLELCDFGVAGRLENGASKRSTIIGTPYWMAPEMHSDVEGYGVEIDVWAYGCTIYEMATGMPPYHKFHPSYLRQVLESEPRLDEELYSAPLCDFVAFLLRGNPADRPTAEQIVQHPYIANTSARFPTKSLRELIDRYMQWERRGGQRMSLFNAMGAAAPQVGGGNEEGRDEWIFSTTDNYNQDYERRFSHMPQGIGAMDFASAAPAEIDLPVNPSPVKMTPLEKAKEEQRAQRGERKLNKLFDPHSDPYDYNSPSVDDEPAPMSDLPLRDFSDDRAANRETLIDLDTSGLEIPDYSFDFSDMPTVKGNRKSNYNFDDGQAEDQDFYNNQANDPRRETKDWKFPAFANTEPNRQTKDWTFPTFATTGPEEDAETGDAGDTGTMKRATKDWTFPGFGRDDAENGGGEEDMSEIANRRTMDWTFATAGNAAVPAEAASPETDFRFPSQKDSSSLAPGYRPHITRTATEPLGHFNDFLHPPPGSLDADKVANRESTPMIDLDLSDDIRPPSLNLEGPSPPNEDAEDAVIRASSPLSYTYSTSSIGPFDLEQDPVVREADLRRYSHKRQQPSVAERRASSRYLRTDSPAFASRSRGASFDSTASSNPEDGRDEPGHGREYNRSMGAKMREQLRAGLQRSFSQRHIRNLTSDSYGDTDTGSEAYALEHGAYDTDGSMPEERTVMRSARTFPEPHAPAATAMREGASQEELYEALDEQFAALIGGLEFTSGVYRRREDELYPEEASERNSTLGTGVTSEEERELAGFSSVGL